MSLAERLRGVIRPSSGANPSGLPGEPERLAPHACGDPAEILGGEWREENGQRFLVVDRHYLPGHRHGNCAVVDSAPGDEGWPSLAIAEPSLVPGRLLFIDLETTGLAGGAGTYAFLVGCGWFERGGFHLRQFLLTGFGSERALLQELARIADDAAGVATYNGKTFDLPLIETRFVMNRMRASLSGMPHLDMLHPARRLWKDDESCKLTMLERTLLGHVREGDVPGFEIPARYFHYVRSGDARPLAAVLEHNRLDILSLALLTARFAALLDEGATAARTGREALGIGRLFERAGRLDAASTCFHAAALLAEDVETAGESLRGSALLLRRARRYDEAASYWRRVLELKPCPPRLAQEAVEALAVHHEHRARQLEVARQFAMQSLSFTATQSRLRAAHHRLARIDRKLGAAEPNHPAQTNLAPLF